MGFHLPEWLTKMIDWSAFLVTITTILSWMPHIAATLAVIWWGFRIYNEWLQKKKLEQELANANK